MASPWSIGSGREVSRRISSRAASFAGGLTRSARHFHTPRLPWDRSGLDIPLLPRFESSVRWAQLPDQGYTGRAAWKDARTAFFDAATGTSDSGRQQSYADTFRIVGQLMHLVADLAQPAHTRNDSHILGDDFETFMASDAEPEPHHGVQDVRPEHPPGADGRCGREGPGGAHLGHRPLRWQQSAG